jgi:hypothetical protein
MSKELFITDGKIHTCPEGIVYWSKKLNCSEKDLIDAIAKIGTVHTVLILYLELNRMINQN